MNRFALILLLLAGSGTLRAAGEPKWEANIMKMTSDLIKLARGK